MNYSDKKELVKYSQKLSEKGFVANHDGNISLKIAKNEYLITPTAVNKGDVTERMLLKVDSNGKKISGEFNPFSEIKLHFKLYKTHPEAKAVIHAHPPYATALGFQGKAITQMPIAEAIVTLGAEVPLVPYTFPGEENEAHFASHCDAFILEKHGVITVGASIEQAYYRLELVEHLSKILSISNFTFKALPESDVQKLLEKHCKVFKKDPGSFSIGNALSNDDEYLKKRVKEELQKL